MTFNMTEFTLKNQSIYSEMFVEEKKEKLYKNSRRTQAFMNFWMRILMIKIVIITIKIQLQEGFNSTGYFCLPKVEIVEMNNYAIFSKKYQGKFLIQGVYVKSSHRYYKAM